MEIKVKVIEGTVYLASEDDTDIAIITQEDWDSLDRTKEYAVLDGNLIEYDDTPLTPQTPPKPSLEAYYDSERCGLREQVNALWIAMGTGDKTEYDRIESLRENSRKKHSEL